MEHTQFSGRTQLILFSVSIHKKENKKTHHHHHLQTQLSILIIYWIINNLNDGKGPLKAKLQMLHINDLESKEIPHLFNGI